MLSSDKEGAELAYHVTELMSTHALFRWLLKKKTKAHLEFKIASNKHTKRQGTGGFQEAFEYCSQSLFWRTTQSEFCIESSILH